MTNEQLLSATEEVFGVDTKKKTRRREYVDARRALVAILRDDFGWTYERAGAPYGFNHATVIHHTVNDEWLQKSNSEYNRNREKLRIKILELYLRESYCDVSTIKRIFVSLLNHLPFDTIERLGEILDSEKKDRLYKESIMQGETEDI